MKILRQALRASVLAGISSSLLYAESPTIAWEKRYDAPYDAPTGNSDEATAVATDGQGNVVVTGTSTRIGTGSDYYTAKYSATDGNLIWEVRYDGPISSHDASFAVAVDGAGNVVVTGASTASAASSTDIYTAKYAAATGALLWEKRYNGTGNGADQGVRVAVDKVGNVMVTGLSTGAEGNADFYTAKYAAADGSLLWEHRYNGPGNRGDEPRSIALDGNGNVVVTGKSADSSGIFECYTVKYASATGSTLWEQRYNGLGGWHDFGNAVAVDSIGNVVICGQSAASNGIYDFYTAKYAAANGALVWEKRYGAVTQDGAVDVALDANNDVVVTGSSGGYYTAKYAAADGSLIWEQSYICPDTASSAHAFALALDSRGNAVVTGRHYGLVRGYYTAKYAAADGSLIWGKEYSADISINAGVDVAVDIGDNVIVTGYSDGGSGPVIDYNFYTVKFETPSNTVTLTPALIAPAANAALSSSANVSFILREAALPGSVKLSFGTTVLTLAASQESLGVHSFTFNPANPTASAEIASGAAVVDGIYTVTLSYQDAQGNPAASLSVLNVTIDTVPPVIGGSFSPLLIVEGALPDYRPQATGAVSYVQTPAPGAAAEAGTVTVTLDGTDAAGNVGHASFDVRVVPPMERSVLESTGAPVPAAGVAESGIPAGAVWTGFGVPSVNGLGQVAFRGEWRAGKVKGAGIFLERALVAAKGVEFPVLGDPMLGDYGNVSFVGETAVFLKPSLGPLRAVARLGDVPVGGSGAVLKRIGSVAMSESGGDFFFTATLGQAPGAQPKVTASNDTALCGVVEGGAPKVLLREGPDTKSFLALTGRPGSAGNGRGVVDQYTLVLANSPRGEKAIMRFLTNFEEPVFPYSLTSDAPGFPQGTKFTKFGLPTQDGDTAIAFRATVQDGVTAIFREDNAFELQRLVATGDSATGLPTGTTFAELRDPVASAGQVVAFTAKLSGGGTKATDDESVWFRNSEGTLTLVAREGAPAAEVGAKWGSFKSIALPEGALGPIILASLKSTPTSKVTAANDVGLWATDSFGALRLLLREGDEIGTAKVKSFVVLPSVRGSAAQRRSFSNGRVIVKATDTAGAQHLVQIAVP
jgi:hypothetical protein